MNRTSLWSVAAAVLLAAGSVQGAIVNGSFETGDFTGWTVSSVSLTSVISSVGNIGGGVPDPFLPTHGEFFGYASAGLEDVVTIISQTFSATAGDTLSFDVFFNGGDVLPFDDEGGVVLSGAGFLYHKFISDVGTSGSDGWTPISYVIPTTGFYTIEAGAVNRVDGFAASSTGLDNVVLTPGTPAVPEPSSLVLFGLGAIGLGWNKFRRRK